VNSAAGSFGLSFGLAMAGGILLATLAFSFTNLTEDSKIIPAADKTKIADKLEDDAQVVSTSGLETLIETEPEPVVDEVLRINTEATHSALQFALLIPVLASLFGVFTAFRMSRLRDGPAV
jgi:hypothetical protein